MTDETQQPTQTTTPNKPKHNWWKIISITVIIILVLAGLGFLGYYEFNKYKTNQITMASYGTFYQIAKAQTDNSVVYLLNKNNTAIPNSIPTICANIVKCADKTVMVLNSTFIGCVQV